MIRRWHLWELRITLGLIVLLLPVILLPSERAVADGGAAGQADAVSMKCPPRDPVCRPALSHDR